jgi:hypothetical protein
MAFHKYGSVGNGDVPSHPFICTGGCKKQFKYRAKPITKTSEKTLNTNYLLEINF